MRRTTLTILGILILAGLCLLSYFYLSFGYGGLNGFISELKQPPSESRLMELRKKAIIEINDAQTKLASLPGLTFHERTYADMCAKGEHGWKRSDSFAYVCAYRTTLYYGTKRDYREVLLELEQILAEGGWEREGRSPIQPTISQALDKASGEVYLVELPDYTKPVNKNIIPGHMILAINSFHGYGVPWISLSDEPSPFGYGLAIGQEYYQDTSDSSPEAIARKIMAAGEQPVMFAISIEYFSN